jgi:hypothetical protein
MPDQVPASRFLPTYAKSAAKVEIIRFMVTVQNRNRKCMKHNEIVLINLYITLRVAKAKADLFKKNEVPPSLTERIENLQAQIMERENVK